MLIVHAKKFQLVNWVPTKLGGCFSRKFPSFLGTNTGSSAVSRHPHSAAPQRRARIRTKAFQHGTPRRRGSVPRGGARCVSIPCSTVLSLSVCMLISPPAAPAAPQYNEVAMAQLQAMGFPDIRCHKALLATGNTDNAEAAMDWLFAHMEDPGAYSCSHHLRRG